MWRRCRPRPCQISWCCLQGNGPNPTTTTAQRNSEDVSHVRPSHHSAAHGAEDWIFRCLSDNSAPCDTGLSVLSRPPSLPIPPSHVGTYLSRRAKPPAVNDVTCNSLPGTYPNHSQQSAQARFPGSRVLCKADGETSVQQRTALFDNESQGHQLRQELRQRPSSDGCHHGGTSHIVGLGGPHFARHSPERDARNVLESLDRGKIFGPVLGVPVACRCRCRRAGKSELRRSTASGLTTSHDAMDNSLGLHLDVR